MPLMCVAVIGRFIGFVVYFLDARHRRVAFKNVTQCFGQRMTPGELRGLVRENFKRIGENFACGAKTAMMRQSDLEDCFRIEGFEKLPRGGSVSSPKHVVVAVGHFGNFEMYAHAGSFLEGYQMVTTYRAFRQEFLNKLLLDLRERSGCMFFERRTASRDLREVMNRSPVILGLLADQNAGGRGVRSTFFGRECSTTAAPAVFALRYQCPLVTAVCYRTSLGKWTIEVGDEIPIRENGRPRDVADIMADVNGEFEKAIMRDPANWFWVHNRWKSRGRKKGVRNERKGRGDNEDGVERILIRGVNWLGDAVMTMPALMRLRAAFPEARISIMTPMKLVDLWSKHPAVDAVIPVSRADGVFLTAGRLRQERFDWGLVFPSSIRSALELKLGGVRKRIGYKAGIRDLLLTERVERPSKLIKMRKRSAGEIRRLIRAYGTVDGNGIPPDAHHMFQYLGLVAAVGGVDQPMAPRIYLEDAELLAAGEMLNSIGKGRVNGVLIGIIPGAEYGPAKRWPLERFAAACIGISRFVDCTFVITGAAGDVELAEQLERDLTSGSGVIPAQADARRMRVINLAGRTSLR
ncbi:MAG: hypothetical protein K9N48_05875, partial [Verrucomicrobia bacterium]|nr:hypothetical protein [Verrucomicrobiota bacterium]